MFYVWVLVIFFITGSLQYNFFDEDGYDSFGIKPPTCDGGKRFCGNLTTYPTAIVERTLRSNRYQLKNFDRPRPKEENKNYSARFYNATYRFVCISSKYTIFPQVAYNTRNQFRYIFNTEKYQQGVEINKCRGDDFFLKNPFLEKRNSVCLQQYQKVILLVFEPNSPPMWETFEFPSYCVCKYSVLAEVKQGLQQMNTISMLPRMGPLEMIEEDAVSSSITKEFVFPVADNTPLEPERFEVEFNFFLEHKGYPSEKTLKLYLNLAPVKKKFSNIPQLLQGQLISKRNIEEETLCLCQSEPYVVYPKAAFNIKNELKFIFNLETFKQGIKVHYCKRDTGCDFFNSIKGLEYTTECVQQYTIKKLLTYNEANLPYMEQYWFPSGCACTYTGKS